MAIATQQRHVASSFIHSFHRATSLPIGCLLPSFYNHLERESSLKSPNERNEERFTDLNLLDHRTRSAAADKESCKRSVPFAFVSFASFFSF
jgi:hypothetical protein